jgi:hypothetical protein
VLLASNVSAQETAQAGASPIARATALTTAPTMDGDVIGDPAWNGAYAITGFSQTRPNAGRPATQKTEVFVGYSDRALHIGVILHDDDPGSILMTDSRRDSELNDTDAFIFIIDGLRDRQNGFVFGTNPAGIEFDGQVTQEATGRFSAGGGGFNKNWDAPWTVRTKVGDFGWSAEFEIPFKTLRFGRDDEQSWGINFQRNIRRNYEVAYWAPLAQDRTLYRVSEAGTIEGIRPPKQRSLLFTPYALGKAQRGGNLSGTESDAEFGFDLKYSLTSSLTLDATYNTDFAQVESDVQQINLDRFSLFFPEKRPFFLENAGQFSVGNSQEVELFFSRRIGIGSGAQTPIDGGLRLSGKVAPSTNVGLLYMAADGVDGIAPGNDFSVVRVNQEFANRSSIGAMFVNRQGDGSHLLTEDMDENQTYAIDGRWGIGDNLLLQSWIAKTDTPGLDGDDEAFAVKANYEDARWNAFANYTEVGGDFNPEVGFLNRKNYKRKQAFVMYKIRPDDLWGLFEIRPHVLHQEYHDFDGFKESAFTHIDAHWEFQNGYQIELGPNLTYEGVKDPFDIVPGVTIQPGVYDDAHVHFVLRTNQAAPLSLNLRGGQGKRWNGDWTQLQPTLRYRIGETFSSELGLIHNKFDIPVENGDFDVNLTRLRLSYSFAPNILLQSLVQYNDLTDNVSLNLRFSWLRSANSGLYVVYNQVDERGIGAPPRGHEFIIKYSHIFDVFK